MERGKKAEELFLSGCNCAQSVLCAFEDVTGMSHSDSMKISSSFGGGMGRLREVCGACTGAFMVAGLLYGGDAIDGTQKAEHYALIQKIAGEFKKINGTYICRELLEGIESSTCPIPSERTPGYYKDRPCCKFVGDAARIMNRIINEKQEG